VHGIYFVASTMHPIKANMDRCDTPQKPLTKACKIKWYEL